jgi:hypothetical protein
MRENVRQGAKDGTKDGAKDVGDQVYTAISDGNEGRHRDRAAGTRTGGR